MQLQLAIGVQGEFQIGSRLQLVWLKWSLHELYLPDLEIESKSKRHHQLRQFKNCLQHAGRLLIELWHRDESDLRLAQTSKTFLYFHGCQ